MDGSKEDGQEGCIGKPYWGVAKKACGVDHYNAPSMDGSKDGQAGGPTAVPATAAVAQGPAAVSVGAPTAAVAAKEPAAPVTGPAGALASAVTKGGPAGGWGWPQPRRLK
jgi:hypothetical protein